jgi:23S rRNA G2069 N7-methylase RlmK/C1962 C5-methylase RlmI
MASLILKPGREKSLLRHHPWIFSGAVGGVEGNPAPGATVEVLSSDRQFLARAAYSPTSQIRARAWTFDPTESVDEAFFRHRLQRAIAARLPPLRNGGFTGDFEQRISPLRNGEGPGVRSFVKICGRFVLGSPITPNRALYLMPAVID